MANGLLKRGRWWHYDIQVRGQRYQGSTDCTNIEKAKQFLSGFRHNLALKRVGLIEAEPLPTLVDFLNGPFTQHVDQQSKTEGTKIAYKRSIKRFVNAPCFQNKKLDEITDKEISEYKQFRLGKENTPATINTDLAVLRKALKWADKGLRLIHYQGVSSLPGANKRTFVLSGELEKEYLSVAPYPLKQVAILMLDLGLRPEEAVSLRHPDISVGSCGTVGTVSVCAGKTRNAIRTLPQTHRTLAVFQFMRELFPCACASTSRESATLRTMPRPLTPTDRASLASDCHCWVFPGREGRHMTAHAISNLHGLTRQAFNARIAVSRTKRTPANSRLAEFVIREAVPAAATPWPAEFCLYSLRHTFATRAAESGMHPLTLSKLLGHYSMKITERYVHIGPEHAAVAMKQAELYAKMLRGEVEVTHSQPPNRESVDRST